jgi:hypothetical protein
LTERTRREGIVLAPGSIVTLSNVSVGRLPADFGLSEKAGRDECH